MSDNQKTIEHLNILLKGELTAINQYFAHAHILEDWGMTKMAAHEMTEATEEKGHASKLISRILLLGGTPDVQSLNKINLGESVEEVIKNDMKLETSGIANYKEAIKHCDDIGDYGTSQILKTILPEEEEHLDGQETQLHMIKSMGLENYIKLQSGTQDDHDHS